MGYLYITRKDLEENIKPYLHCDHCGETELAPYKEGDDKVCCDCGKEMEVVYGIHVDGHDFVFIEDYHE